MDFLVNVLSDISGLFLCLGPPEQFENWLSTFRLEEMKGEISELLVNSPSIRALYTKMVSFFLFCIALCQAVL